MLKVFTLALGVFFVGVFGQTGLVDQFVDFGIVAVGGAATPADPDCNASDTETKQCYTAIGTTQPGCGSYAVTKAVVQIPDVLGEQADVCQANGCQNESIDNKFNATKCKKGTKALVDELP
jgi:hypothetical protein